MIAARDMLSMKILEEVDVVEKEERSEGGGRKAKVEVTQPQRFQTRKATRSRTRA